MKIRFKGFHFKSNLPVVAPRRPNRKCFLALVQFPEDCKSINTYENIERLPFVHIDAYRRIGSWQIIFGDINPAFVSPWFSYKLIKSNTTKYLNVRHRLQ